MSAHVGGRPPRSDDLARDTEEAPFVAALAALDEMGPARLRTVLGSGSPRSTWLQLVAGEHPRWVEPGGSGPDDIRSASLMPGAAVPDGRGAVVGEVRAAGSKVDDKVTARWIASARGAADLPSVMEGRLASLAARVCVGAGLPERLRDDPDPPAALFCTGGEVPSGRARVAVIGTRRASQYGLRVAHGIGRDLTAAGVGVVSGLALGIDAAAHAGTLEVIAELIGGDAPAGGNSPAGTDLPVPVGVIGAGHDRPCPSRNRALARAVQRHGSLLGEVPPGVASAPWRFPVRNRLIAGLADVVVVVESAPTGGSMSTVTEALRRDVPVMAVPGPLGRSTSEGCHQLLRDGAQVCTGVDDIIGMLELLGAQVAPVGGSDPTGSRQSDPGSPRSGPRDPSANVSMPPLDTAILDVLADGRRDVGSLADRTGSSLAEVASALVRLESLSLVRRAAGWVERR
ncbi:MAG: DNA-processing protein DprA [Microthrixaceae bacterium]